MPQEIALTIADQIDFVKAVKEGSMLPAAYRGNPSNVMIAVGLGQSMGLSPAESLYRINVIQGKPTASAELIAAQVRKAGHKLRISKDEAHMSVTATVVRCDDPDYPISATRDAAWAESMGLSNKDNYKKQPMTMLTWRAITAAAREACPEALYGVAYTPDEMEDVKEPSTHQEPLQVKAEAVETIEKPTQWQKAVGDALRKAKAQGVSIAPIKEHIEANIAPLSQLTDDECGQAIEYIDWAIADNQNRATEEF